MPLGSPPAPAYNSLEYVSNPVTEQIAASADLTEHAITPPNLSTYSIHKVLLVGSIHSVNEVSGTDQQVTVKVYGKKGSGSYSQLGATLTNALEMSTVQYSPDSLTLAIDVSTLVDTLDGSTVYTFKFNVTLANAQNTRFTHQFILVCYIYK